MLGIVLKSSLSVSMKENTWQMLKSSLCVFQEVVSIGQWSLIGPGSEKKSVFYGRESAHMSLETTIAEKMLMDVTDHDWMSRFSVPRLRCPGCTVRSAKDTENCRIQFVADQVTIEISFRIHCFCISVQSLRSSR